MSTAYEKEAAAGRLRVYADELRGILDDIPTMSAAAWQCPAATSFEDTMRQHDGNLESVAATLVLVAASLEATAAQQRADIAAAAAAASVTSAGGPAPPVF